MRGPPNPLQYPDLRAERAPDVCRRNGLAARPCACGPGLPRRGSGALPIREPRPAAVGVPAVSPPSWRVPGGGCLLSSLGDCVSDLVEIAVFKDGGFSLWIERTPIVLQEPLNLVPSQKGSGVGGPAWVQGHESAPGAMSLGFPGWRLYRFLPQECVITNYFLVSSHFLK